MSSVVERLSWKHASILMALATAVPPYTTFLWGFGGHDNRVSIAVYALIWALYPPESSIGGLQVLNSYSLPIGISLGFFNIIFAFQVIRFLRGATSKRNTLWTGALTLVIPMISLIVAWPTMASSGFFAYIGPIPIQLATGLLLMHFVGPKEPTSPW